jgi:ribokinase
MPDTPDRSTRDAPLDVLTVADLCVDLVVTGDVVPRFGQAEQLVDGYAMELGGSATICAAQLANLGARAGVIGALGNDTFGDFAATRLGEVGLCAERVVRTDDTPTGLGVALVKPDGDRGILTVAGTIDATRPDSLTEDALSSARHWHIASYFLLASLREAWPSWLRRCRDAGVTTSLDTNWDPAERWAGVAEILPLVDVFLPNAAEARAIAGEADVTDAGRRLAEHGCLVVVKRGAAGATAFEGRTVTELDARDVTPPGEVVDSIGAGDCFDAGFLRGWMLGWDTADCLSLAHRCGRASLAAAGGFRGQLIEDVATANESTVQRDDG